MSPSIPFFFSIKHLTKGFMEELIVMRLNEDERQP